jgi:hypothetical protein
MAVISLTGYKPSPRHDGKWWTEARIEGATSEAGSYAELETVTLDPVEPDPTAPLERSFTTEEVTNQTWVRVVFVDADGDEESTLPVALVPTTFATRSDVQLRLGRDLTADEEGQVDYLLQAATDMVAAVISKPSSYTPVPALVRRMTAELVARGLATPVGVTSTREQLGEYSYSQSFPGAYEGGGMALTAFEQQLLRSVVWSTNIASARVDSIAFDAEPWS